MWAESTRPRDCTRSQGWVATVVEATATTRLYLPKWSFARVVRIAALGLLMAGVIETARTTPYLGLPLEPEPRFLDCYRQAAWDGKAFVETGRTICLGER